MAANHKSRQRLKVATKEQTRKMASWLSESALSKAVAVHVRYEVIAVAIAADVDAAARTAAVMGAVHPAEAVVVADVDVAVLAVAAAAVVEIAATGNVKEN